jgi:Skp family chaperone for outer membrane proteins
MGGEKLKMNNKFISTLVALSAGLIISGCDQMGGNAPVAIIDLGAIAEATGQDEIIQMKAEAMREELGQQLQQVAAELDSNISAEREKMGTPPTAEEEQQLQFMTMQARQQLGEVQAQAQAQAGQAEEAIVMEFRDQVIPLAQEIAAGMGSKIVMADDSYLVWYDESLDITDEVIAAWRARPAEESADAATAELEEELEEVEEELAETQEELEELQEVVESAPEESAAE